jgi:hypothetical protein
MRLPVPDYNRPASSGSLELRKRENTEFIGQEIDYSADASAPVDVIVIDDVEGMKLEVLIEHEEDDRYKPTSDANRSGKSKR